MEYALIFVIIILIIDRLVNKKDNKQEGSTTPNAVNYSSLYSKKEYLLTQEELKLYKLLKDICKTII